MRRVTLLASAVVLAASVVRAQPSEYQVKAAYLYNFSRYVQWRGGFPAVADTFPICVVGRDPFGSALDAAVVDGVVDGRRVTVRRLARADDATQCRIVFISASEEAQLPQVLRQIASFRPLTVSDIPEFTRRGGVIQFVPDANRVRFEVNITSASDAGIMLSSELLKVAVTVRRTRPGA